MTDRGTPVIPSQGTTQGPRVYTTDLHGCGIRREPDDADIVLLEKAGRKVFSTKGDDA